MLYSHLFERAGVQSFWEAFKRIEGFLNKTEQHLAKLEELVIFLLKGSVIILTSPNIIAHTRDFKSVLNVQSCRTAVLLICPMHVVTVELAFSTEW